MTPSIAARSKCSAAQRRRTGTGTPSRTNCTAKESVGLPGDLERAAGMRDRRAPRRRDARTAAVDREHERRRALSRADQYPGVGVAHQPGSGCRPACPRSRASISSPLSRSVGRRAARQLRAVDDRERPASRSCRRPCASSAVPPPIGARFIRVAAQSRRSWTGTLSRSSCTAMQSVGLLGDPERAAGVRVVHRAAARASRPRTRTRTATRASRRTRR